MQVQSTQRFTRILLFICVFIIPLVLRQRELGSSTVDFQILIKLGFWAGCLGFGLLFFRHWSPKLKTPDSLLLLLLMGMMAFSSLYSPSFSYSAGCAFSIIAIVLFFYVAMDVLGEESVLRITFNALSLLALLSLVAYVAVPSIGRFSEWEMGVHVAGNRLSGVVGTANIAGDMAAIAVLCGAVLVQFMPRQRSLLFWGCLGLNLLCLLLTDSRTSMAALAVAVLAMQVRRVSLLHLALILFAIVFSVIAASLIDFKSLFSALSRSGNADEILTGTGRSFIWKTVIMLIKQKPILGWGFASSSFILPSYADIIGHAPPHSHNAFLQSWFTLGIFGLVFYVGLLVVILYRTLSTPDRVKLGFFLYILLTSFTESSFVKGSAGMPLIPLALIVSSTYRPRISLPLTRILFKESARRSPV